jgi:hypothetical protein
MACPAEVTRGDVDGGQFCTMNFIGDQNRFATEVPFRRGDRNPDLMEFEPPGTPELNGLIGHVGRLSENIPPLSRAPQVFGGTHDMRQDQPPWIQPQGHSFNR